MPQDPKSDFPLNGRWGWQQRPIDPQDDHFDLAYSELAESISVARVGKPIAGKFGVQFVIDLATPKSADIIRKVEAELDYYLVKLGEADPWAYLKHHCSSSSNLYSQVHWSFHPAGADFLEAEATSAAAAFTDQRAKAPEIVMKIGTEGGSITVFREREANGDWQFMVKRDETTLYDLLSDEDQSGMSSEDFGRSDYVYSFREALSQLDKYPWHLFHPLQVHPEFLDRVLDEVGNRGGPNEITRWREVLKRSTNR